MRVSPARLLVAAVAWSASLVSAASLEGKVQYNELIPSRSALSPSLKVALDYGEQHAFVLASGTFRFSDVTPGLHTLQLLAPSHVFQEFYVVVPGPRQDYAAADESEGEGEPAYFVGLHSQGKVLPIDPASPPSVGSLPYPVEFVALAKVEYFGPPGSFDALGMLKSPMILMMIAGAAMMFGLPYLTSMVDPEALEEANKMLGRPPVAARAGGAAGGEAKTAQWQGALADDELAPLGPPAAKVKSKGGKKKK